MALVTEKLVYDNDVFRVNPIIIWVWVGSARLSLSLSSLELSELWLLCAKMKVIF